MQRLSFGDMAQFFPSDSKPKLTADEKSKKRMQCFDLEWIKQQAELAGVSVQEMRRELMQ